MRISASRACIVIAAIFLFSQLYSWQSAPQSTVHAASGLSVYLPLILQGSDKSTISAVAQQVVELTNAERAKFGCAPLTISPELSAAAQRHSSDMALHDRFSHIGSDGSDPARRIKEAGYRYTRMAENIAAGGATAEDVMKMWKKSDPHYKAMTNCDLHEIGVGFFYQPDDQANIRYDDGTTGHGPFYYYWTQDFGTP